MKTRTSEPASRPETRRPAAIVLAAGASTRFGGDPKALAPIDGEPAVVRMIRIAREAGCDPIRVVVGGHAARTRPVLEGAGAAVIDNPGWEEGRTGSVQAGLAGLEGRDAVLVWPVDFPFVEIGTLWDLRRAADADALALWIVPTFEGRGGHPVVVKRGAWADIAGLTPDQPLRSLLPRLGPQVLRVAVADPAVVANTDTQEAFAEALSQWHRRRRVG